MLTTNPMLDARYVRLWAPTPGEPDPLPPEVREDVEALLKLRSSCPESAVPRLTEVIREVLDPYVEERVR